MNLDNVKSKKILSPTTYLKTFIILNTKKVKSVWKDTSHKNLMTKCKKCHCHNYNSYRKCRGFRSIHLASFTVHQIKGMWVWTGLVFVLRLNTILGFEYWASTRPRLQTFKIRLENKSWVGTLIRQNLLPIGFVTIILKARIESYAFCFKLFMNSSKLEEKRR